MNEILQNFLVKNLKKEGFIIRRLDDRSTRRGLLVHRKNVHLVVFGRKKQVLLHFANEYRTIYDNYVKAWKTFGLLLQKKNWFFDKDHLIILMPYFGQKFSSTDCGVVKSIVNLLVKLHKPTKSRDFIVPRYISRLLDLDVGLLQLRLVITRLKKGRYFDYGCGIEDPAFSNFTVLKRKVFLVDLDNFSRKINLDYELGFLSSDINLEFHNKSYTLFNFEKILGRKIDLIMFDLGYISRLATVILDFYARESVPKRRVDTIYLKIEKFSRELLKILE